MQQQQYKSLVEQLMDNKGIENQLFYNKEMGEKIIDIIRFLHGNLNKQTLEPGSDFKDMKEENLWQAMMHIAMYYDILLYEEIT